MKLSFVKFRDAVPVEGLSMTSVTLDKQAESIDFEAGIVKLVSKKEKQVHLIPVGNVNVMKPAAEEKAPPSKKKGA